MKKKKKPMSIYLPEKLFEFVDQQVETGLFSSRSDYIASLVRIARAFGEQK